MDNAKNDYKIILKCTEQGAVDKIYLDTGALLEDIELPVGLHSLVSHTSIDQLGNFWLSIMENSIVENAVLSLRYNDKQISFIFSGYLLKDTVILCGNTEMTSTARAMTEVMCINNEQANQIRLTEKKIDHIQREMDKMEVNEDILNDFTSLNNELINNKRELMRKNQKIELLNKELNAVNENMTVFTYSVSHDLKEPLRMIKSFLHLFHKKYGQSLDPKGQSYINFAMDGANRLSNMMEDLLKYHKSSDLGTMESVDLNEVLQEVKYILQKEIEEKSARITFEKLPLIKGSPTGLRQVLQNLISNAIKFVPGGRTPVVAIGYEEDRTHYTFSVKDNGIGIPENKRQEVFNLFKRLNSPQQYVGTGMGLAMVRKSIERMGGKIWLESEVDQGTTVYFTIQKRLEP